MIRRLDMRRWSLARQLVVLQVFVVVVAVGIEAMAGVYHAPGGSGGWSQRQLLGLVALTEVALTAGIAGSLLLAGRVRKQTFNLEPGVIARQYQHHHAMLHAVREGLIITDRQGIVVLANDEARRLLRLPPESEGRHLGELVDDTELAALAAGGTSVLDQVHVVAGRVLVISRRPAEVNGKPVGLVTTLRDRTELQQALRELDTVRTLATALRAQYHESANRLQALVGLVELGRYDDAIQLGTRDAARAQELTDQMLERVGDPALAALLLSKTAIADERGIELRLAGDSAVAELRLPVQDVLTVVGNLLDNALDAVAAQPDGRVELTLRIGQRGGLCVIVRDNGPGVQAEPIDRVFSPGWTTKPSQHPGGRGLGLALARHAISRLGGTISARNDGGAVFEAYLPDVPASAREVVRA